MKTLSQIRSGLQIGCLVLLCFLPEQKTRVEKTKPNIELVRAKTPMKRIIKECLIQKIDAVPGCIQSSRGRRIKLQTCVSALDLSGAKLFRQMEHHFEQKLMVDWSKLSSLMAQHGGHKVFGSWCDWGCPFDLRYLQQHWEDKAWRDLNMDEPGHLHTNFQFRPTCVTLTDL